MKVSKWHPAMRVKAIVRCGTWTGLLIFALSVMASPRQAFAGQNAGLSPRAQAIFLVGTTDLKNGSFPTAVAALEEFLKFDNYSPLPI
jgi:hypothetical protein